MEMELYEKCPRCGSMSCETDLSTDDRKTNCSSCGFSGNISTFREHKGFEKPKHSGKPTDFFGNKILSSDKLSERITMLDKMGLNSNTLRDDKINFKALN